MNKSQGCKKGYFCADHKMPCPHCPNIWHLKTEDCGVCERRAYFGNIRDAESQVTGKRIQTTENTEDNELAKAKKNKRQKQVKPKPMTTRDLKRFRKERKQKEQEQSAKAAKADKLDDE